MKHLLCFSILVVTCAALCAQQPSIDSLISKIDNNQLFGTCNYAWVLKNSSKEADSLIALAGIVNSKMKPMYKYEIANKLVSLLTDTSKGIIAHFILSNIWTQFVTMRSVFLNDSLSTIRYQYTGLDFYWNEKRGMYALQEQLEENKVAWQKRLIGSAQ